MRESGNFTGEFVVLVHCIIWMTLVLGFIPAPSFGQYTEAEVGSIINASLLGEDPAKRRAAVEVLFKIGLENTEVRSELIEALRSGDEFIASQASDIVEGFGRGAVPLLKEVVRSRNAVARRNAVSVLGRLALSDEACDIAVEGLIEALVDYEKVVRDSAIKALSGTGRPAVPQLISALSNDDERVCEGASVALGKMGLLAGDAAPELTRALGDGNAGVREAAAAALGKIGRAVSGTVPSLKGLLKDNDIGVRNSAVYALSGIAVECGSQQAIDALVDALGYEGRTMRTGIIDALSGTGKAAVPALTMALRSNDSNVRRAASVALGKIGPDANNALPALIVALKDNDSDVREAAAGALGKMGTSASGAVPVLIESMSDEDSSVRDAALFALSTITVDNKDDGDVLAAYVKAMGDEKGFISSRALELVVDSGESAVPALLEALDSDNGNLQRVTISALGKIGPEAGDAVPRLIKELRGGDDSLREAAAVALGEIGPGAREALPALREVRVLDENTTVRRRAAEAIGKIELR